jgi:sugar-specific transcriptional regulator TrmB
MGKLEKKKEKLQERIDFLQSELNQSLTKKSGKTPEINVSEYQRKILELRVELINLSNGKIKI